MNKAEILLALRENREKMMMAMEGLTDEQLLEPGVVGEWSVKDLLYHLTLWEAEFVRLLWLLSQNLTPTTAHFSGRSDDEINAEWQREGKSRSLEQVLADFEAVRKQTIRRVSELSDRDLNNPRHFPALALTSERSLIDWISDNSYGHEAEHTEQVTAWRREKGI